MTNYRITISPLWGFFEFAGWEWHVHSTESEGGLLAEGVAYYRWLAVRRANKYCRNLERGVLPAGPSDGSLDYTYYPNIREGFSNE